MKRNELLAKSLTLGLAVATAATSMSVPGGLLAPETVYAEEAGTEGVGGAGNSEGEATDTRTVLNEENIGQYIGLGSSVISVNSKAETAVGVNVHYLTKTGWSEEKYGKCVVKYRNVGGSEWINPTFQVGESYDVYVNVDDKGTELAAAKELIKIGTVKVYEDWESKDYYLQCKDGESGEPLVMDENYGTFDKGTNDFKNQMINDAIILAPDGMKISTTVDGEYTSKVIIPREKLLGGSKGMDIFAKIDSQPQIYAKNVHVYFKLLNGDEKRISGSVELAGEAIIGKTLKASVTSDDKDTTYQYRFVREKDGKEEVAQAFGQSDSYTITKDDVGCTIKVIVTATTENMVGELVSDATAIVKKKVCDAPTFGENCFDEATRTLTATVTDGITAAQLEYSLDGGNTWVNGNVENSILTVDGTSAALKLPAQAYNANAIQIRVAETDDTEASKEALYENAIARKGVNLAEAKVSLTDDNKTAFTYTGKPVFDADSVTVVYGENKTLNASAYKVYYTDSTATEAGTNTVAPTAVGDYKLWIVPASEDSEDCYGSTTLEFNITAAKVTTTEELQKYVNFGEIPTLTYNKQNQSDTVCEKVTIKKEYEKDTAITSISFKKENEDDDVDMIGAGTYDVYVGLAGNYETEDPVKIDTVTIAPYETKASDITVEGNASTYYGGEVLYQKMNVNDLLDWEKVKLTYKQVENGNGDKVTDAEAFEKAPENAGKYDIYVAYIDDDLNCKNLDATKTGAQIVITKADKKVTAGQLVVNSGDDKEQSIDLKAIVNELTCTGVDQTIKANVTSDDGYFAADGLKYADGVIKVKLDTAKTSNLPDNTKATIHVDFGNSFNNYKVAFDIPVVITTKKVANITIANATNGILGTYGKVPEQLTFTISGVEGLDLTKKTDAEIASACLEKYGNSNWAFGCTIHNQNGEEVKSIENAGTYSVHVTYWDSKCYGEITDVIVVEPKKIEQTADFNGILSLGTASFAYNFENQYDAIKKLVQLDAKDGVGSGDYDVVIKKGDSETEDASDAGSYGVYIVFNHGNYTTSGKLVQLGTVDIAKNKDAITLDVAKDGTPIVRVGSRTIPNGELQQILYVDKNGKESKVKPTAAGKYKVKVSYTNSNLENKLEGAEKEFAITSGGSSGSSSSGGSTSGGSSAGGGAATTPSKDDTKKDDTKKDTTTKTETKPDGTKVTTTETKAADGSVQTKIELKNDTAGVDATVNVAKDAQGKVTGVTADVNQTATDKQTAISAATVAQITAAAGTKDVAITTKTVDANGKTVREVTVNASDLTAGKKLKVVAIDPKTGEKTLVNKTTYKVAADGSLALDNLGNDSYEVVTTAEVNALTKEILQSIRPERSKANIAAGKKTKLSLDDALNMDNVAKITYKTSKKSVATVNPNGTVTARKEGKVTIKAIVTLNNGKKKTVRMNLTVKARK